MQTAAQCVLIGMQTKVAGKFCPPPPCLFCFSACTFPLLSSIHPSSCSYLEKPLHIAASFPPLPSPPPLQPPSLTLKWPSQAQHAGRWEKTEAECYVDREKKKKKKKKKEKETEEMGWWRCGKWQRRWRCVEKGDVQEDDEREREEGEKLHESESENTKTGDVRWVEGGRTESQWGWIMGRRWVR